MYKNILLICIIVMILFIPGCSKKELSHEEVINLYLNAAFNNNANISKGTGYENEISEFVFYLKNREWMEIVYYNLEPTGAVYSQEEFNRLLAVNQKLRAMSKIKVSFLKNEENQVYIRANINLINKYRFKELVQKKLNYKIKTDERKLLNGNIKQRNVMQNGFIYYVEAHEEAAEEIINNSNNFLENKEINNIVEYNADTNKWEFYTAEQTAINIINITKYV